MPAKKITASAKKFNKQIGRRIKLYRNARKMSLETFCKELGVTLNQVTLYEKGTGDMKISRLKQIADVLQTTIYELLPDMENADYQPFPDEVIELLVYLTKNKFDIGQVLESIKQDRKEGFL